VNYIGNHYHKKNGSPEKIDEFHEQNLHAASYIKRQTIQTLPVRFTAGGHVLGECVLINPFLCSNRSMQI
ncbi:MAG: hypothetical protein MJ184_11485, partial [Treponema sp.]|uniref:hypothetical protein n=1 Tax=Treponema sp. TaxID=166 RepID=UPI00298D6283